MAQVVCRIVEVCVFRRNAGEPEFLLMQRAPTETVYPGLWQFVSGKIREGEQAKVAALRELKEETSLPHVAVWTVPYTGSFYDPALDEVNLVPWFAVEVEKGNEPVLSKEHTRYAWLTFADARERLVWPGQRDALKIVHTYILGDEEAGRRLLIEE